MLLGSLPKTADAKYDLSQAKSWLAKSGVGHPSLKLTYPTGITVNGLSFDDAAARLEQYLDQIGINVTLQPESLQVGLASYRAGTEPLGLWFWGPDYADPEDYLAFAPGHPWLASGPGGPRQTVRRVGQRSRPSPIKRPRRPASLLVKPSLKSSKTR